MIYCTAEPTARRRWRRRTSAHPPAVADSDTRVTASLGAIVDALPAGTFWADRRVLRDLLPASITDASVQEIFRGAAAECPVLHTPTHVRASPGLGDRTLPSTTGLPMDVLQNFIAKLSRINPCWVPLRALHQDGLTIETLGR